MTFAERIAVAVRDADSIPRWRVGLYAFLAGAGLAVAVAAVAVGQGLVTPPVEREVETRIIVREREKKRTARRADVAQDTTATAKLLALPDGGVLLAYDFDTRLRTTTTSSTDSEISRAVDTSQKSTERPVLPSWRVGVQVGGQFAGRPAVALPQAPGLVFGVEASYRLPLDRLGLPPRYGIWAGVWGGTYGAAGASVSGEF